VEKYKEIIPYIDVGPGVINNVSAWVVSSGYKSVLVVCDPNTYRVAGEYVIDSLRVTGLTVAECCFTEDEPLPDEYAIGYITAAYTPDIDLILGVGSGTINDICTFVGERVSCPSAIVGTAPSMDGYASLGSAMLLDGLKVTPPTQCPVAIFCDVDILAAAPLHLIAAGLGDMLGKITALADWRLAHIMVGESIPEDILAIIESALDKIVKGAPHLTKRDPAVIQSVTEGLILSGIAMSLYGDSRPASGTEHHLAHFWEMRMIAEGKKPALHGAKVGVATVVGLVLWKEFAKLYHQTRLHSGLDMTEDSQIITVKNHDVGTTCKKDTENEIRRLYGRSAEAILQTENPNLPVQQINVNLRTILDIATSLPAPEEVAAMLAAVDAPIRPSEIDLDVYTLNDSIIYARDRKKIYTVLQLLGDLGLLEDFAERIIKYFETNSLSGVKCFILDMDGTMYLSDKLFPYTTRFLEHLKNTGKDYYYYTNNSSQNTEYYLNKLQCMGIPIPHEKLLMSTHVLLAHLAKQKKSYPTDNNKSCDLTNNTPSAINDISDPANNTPSGDRVFVAGTKALKDDFEAAGYILSENDPDFVVLGFDTDMDYKRLTKLCDFVRSGLPYYGVHIDYNCPVEGGFIPDCGSLAAAVTASTKITPEFFGKPSRYTLDYILSKTGYKENELCFIGDRLYTDIAITSGTQARSVLVLSGETKLSDLHGSEYTPDMVVEDLAQLMMYIS